MSISLGFKLIVPLIAFNTHISKHNEDERRKQHLVFIFRISDEPAIDCLLQSPLNFPILGAYIYINQHPAYYYNTCSRTNVAIYA